jgi:hypothetical protein
MFLFNKSFGLVIFLLDYVDICGCSYKFYRIASKTRKRYKEREPRKSWRQFDAQLA